MQSKNIFVLASHLFGDMYAESRKSEAVKGSCTAITNDKM